VEEVLVQILPITAKGETDAVALNGLLKQQVLRKFAGNPAATRWFEPVHGSEGDNEFSYRN
jgi:hypothetical protein